MNESWIRASWPVPGNIVAGTTLRGGGVSRGEFGTLNLAGHVGDDPAAVAENRSRFMVECGLPGEPAWLRQVHGKKVIRTNSPSTEFEADAIVTGQAGLVCAVLTADCLPVLLATDDGTEIAAAHAGWRRRRTFSPAMTTAAGRAICMAWRP
jgi:copper oxidase (laccase) domain-containing protein